MQSKPEYKMFLKAVVDLYTLGVDVTWKNMPTQGDQVTDIPRYGGLGTVLPGHQIAMYFLKIS